jgi:TetR/AcrR family transcriptional repressor of nem operon
MARPREFDPEDVLSRAQEVFWSRGYRSTSLDDVTEATGVNKPSLYAAFGGKGELFCAVLDRYHAMLLGYADLLLGAPTAREGLSAWLRSFLPLCTGAIGERGCLSINAVVGGALDEPGVLARIVEYNRQLEQKLVATCERGIRSGDLPPDFDPVATVQLLLTFRAGLMVNGRLSTDPARAEQAIQRTLGALGL